MNDRRINYFDSTKFEANNSLTFFISSSSLIGAIKSQDNNLKKLCRLSVFKEINVVFSEPIDIDCYELLNELFDCNIGKYSYENGIVYFSAMEEKYDIIRCSKEKYDDFKIDKSAANLSTLDYITMRSKKLSGLDEFYLYDYYVCDENDINEISKNFKCYTMTEAFEIARLYLLKCNCFYICEDCRYDEVGYYFCRSETLFAEYRRLWHLYYQSGKTDIIEWMESLSTRLELFCRAIDLVKIECLKSQNNNSALMLVYHLGYALLLITGIFDNVAWILNDEYKLRLGKMKVVLKLIKTSDGSSYKESDFVKEIKKKNVSLANYILTNQVQDFMNMIYLFRDRLIHRKHFETVSSGNKVEQVNKICVTKEMKEEIECCISDKKVIDEVVARVLGEYYLDPWLFICEVETKFYKIINQLLAYIRPEYKIEEQPVYTRFRFPCEPYY